MIRIFISFFIFLTVLEADIFDHLKKIENKTNGHSIRNVDFIYMINLDIRPEKYARSCKQLLEYNIKPFRFSAINGWQDFTLEIINDVGVKYRIGMDPIEAFRFDTPNKIPRQEKMSEVGESYLGFGTLGTLGCAMSHISVMQDALDSGYDTIWIMEDDIEVLQNPHKISGLIDELDRQVGKNNWDILFTDRDWREASGNPLIAKGRCPRPDMDNRIFERYRKEYCYDEKISKDFRRIGARFATHSMIIRRSGIIKLLDYYKTHSIFLPIDLENYVSLEIHRYTVLEDVVSNQLLAPSDNASLLRNK